VGILTVTKGVNNKPVVDELKFNLKTAKNAVKIDYQMSAAESDRMAMIIKHFTLGYLTMYTPRVELDDLCVIDRMQVDQMAFNSYRPNNGMPALSEDDSWRSNAMRPVVRNKVISICAHATARLIFPMIYAEDSNSDNQHEAAAVMSNLIEWSGEQSGYDMYALQRTLTALTDPVSIGFTEYAEVYKDVKMPTTQTGVYVHQQMKDEILSGFQDKVVPCDELFIENFYEPDIQKQSWLIWRRVISYDLAQAKYGTKPNFKYVEPGVQILYNDANQSFYQVYDTNMRPYDCEEIIYFNRKLDLKIAIVNRVFMDDVENPNPRNDKLYPFDTFGYEFINNRCFYYKSLVNKLGPEADIINTIYPMVVDGTYLEVFPAMFAISDNDIDSSVIVPGRVTTFESADSQLSRVTPPASIAAGQALLTEVQEKIGETAGDMTAIDESLLDNSNATAYAISRVEARAATILGPFVKMISKHVKDYGRLRLGDITQYLTLPEVELIEDNAPLVYKTFLLRNKKDSGKSRAKKIVFDASITNGTEDHATRLNRSFAIKKEEEEKQITLMKTNPVFFRNLKYTAAITPDVLNPMSTELERAYGLEDFDRMIASPTLFDQTEAARLFLQGSPLTRKDPDKYLIKTDPLSQISGGVNPLGQFMGQPNIPNTQAPQENSPVMAAKTNGLPQTQPATALQ
jgi:hypothetical protein